MAVRSREALLLAGLVGSRLVDGLVGVGALVLVVQRGSSTSVVAGATAARLAPLALLGLGLTVLAHRPHRRRVLAVSAVLRAVLAGVLAVQAGTGAGDLLEVVVLAAAVALAGAPYQPAGATLVARVAGEGRLVAASAAYLAADTGAVLAAPAACGALLLVSSPQVVFTVAAAVAAGVAATAAGLPADRTTGAPAARRLLDGLRLVLQVRDARSLLLVRAATRVVLGTLLVVLAVLPARLGLPAAETGFLQAALALGGGAAAFALRRLLVRARPAPAVAAGLVVLGGACAAVALEPPRAVLLVVLVVAGGADLALHVTCRLALARTLPAGTSVAATGAAESLTAGGLLVGTLAAPLLLRRAGAGSTGSTAPATLAAAGLLAVVLLLLLPQVVGVGRRTEQRRRAALDAVAALSGVAVLRGLPAAALQRLAEVAVPARVRRGALLVREGDPAEQVWVLLRGRLQVHVSGDEATRTGRLGVLLPGALLGEVGVLHRRPRTASVVALEDSTVLQLPGPELLAALGADEDAERVLARQAAEALARSHGARPPA